MTRVEVLEVDPDAMSVKDAARYLGVSTRRIYELLSAGELGPDIHEGTKRLIAFDAVQTYARRRRAG